MNTQRWRLIFMAVSVMWLTVLPMPMPIYSFMPLWGILGVLYVQLSLHQQYSIWAVVGFGLLLDVLEGSILGMHSVAFVATLWVASPFAMRFRLLPMAKQMLSIFGLISLYQAMILLGHYASHDAVILGWYMLPVLISALSWPWLQYMCDRFFFATVR